MASYYVEEEFNLETFEAWGGAVGKLIEIKELGVIDEAQLYMEDVLYHTGGVVTSTDVNDMLWFGMDDFIQYFVEMQEGD